MAQNYAAKYLKLIDERFYSESKSQEIVNNGMRMDFDGVNTVTIYNVDTVPEGNYIRSGYNRYGALIELGSGVETYVLSQDKSFTFSVDRGNLEDSMLVTDINDAVKRQVREVSVPATDVYRFAAAFAYARTAAQGTTGSLTSTTIYDAVLVQKAALINALVPEENIICYLTATMLNNLKTDPKFKLASDAAYASGQSGKLTAVDGMRIRVLPTAYLPTNMNFMLIADNVMVSPTKFNSVKIHIDPPGINGGLAEGRRYYDAFIPTNKGVAIRYHATS